MTPKKKFPAGFTLIELMAAIVLSMIAILGVSSMMNYSWIDWKTSQQIVSLQSDLDYASYLIKGVLEEADEYTIPTASHITARYSSNWNKEFYQNGTDLIYKNLDTGSTETVIKTLKSLTFVESSTVALVSVNLTIAGGSREMTNNFYVYLKNKGGG